MTRETKIGMLVGLGVIVLIGVLLSEYLGDGVRGGPQADLAKFRGEGFRQSVMQDVGVPSVKAGVVANGDPVVRQNGDLAMAVSDNGTQSAMGGPLVGQPVTPQDSGAIPPETQQGGTTPVRLDSGSGDAIFVAGNEAQQNQGAAQPRQVVVMQPYVIQKNDTVKLLAKKFYGAAGAVEVARLVNANPGVLRDAGTMLVIGRKLNVPTLVTVGGQQQVMMPRSAGQVVPQSRATVIPPPAGRTLRTYTVLKGDTISGIAKKVMGTGGPISVSEIFKANGLKAGATIREGMVLNVPVKP